MRKILPAVLLVSLSACGLKDDLYLPEERAERQPATAPAQAPAADDEEEAGRKPAAPSAD